HSVRRTRLRRRPRASPRSRARRRGSSACAGGRLFRAWGDRRGNSRQRTNPLCWARGAHARAMTWGDRSCLSLNFEDIVALVEASEPKPGQGGPKQSVQLEEKQCAKAWNI